MYVPSDPAFDSVDYGWQAPNDEHGSLAHVTYDSPGHVNPVGQNYLAIYTPPAYDPARANPYPTLYLNHGGGGNEMDWSTQGNLGNIMDNLIDVGEIQPMVVVMANANGYPSSTNNGAFRADLIDTRRSRTSRRITTCQSAQPTVRSRGSPQAGSSPTS